MCEGEINGRSWRKGISMSNNGWGTPMYQAPAPPPRPPQKKGKLPIYLVIGAFVLIVMIVLGFGLNRLFAGDSGDDSSEAGQVDDGSNVPDPEQKVGGAVSVDDHDGLTEVLPGQTVEGIDFSGDSTDLYLLVSAQSESDYSLTTYSTDESGKRIENEMRNISDTTKVLTPEETGLRIREGVLTTDDEKAQRDCEQTLSPHGSHPSDPGCAYGVSGLRSGNITEDDNIVLVMIDGTGKTIHSRDIWTSTTEVFFKNEGGKIVMRND